MSKQKKWFKISKPQLKGNFTQVPNTFITDAMLYVLSGTELKVLLYFLRHRPGDKFSYEQIGKVFHMHPDHVRKMLRSLRLMNILLHDDQGGYELNIYLDQSKLKTDKLAKEIESLKSGQKHPDITGQNYPDMYGDIFQSGQDCPDKPDQIARIENPAPNIPASQIVDFGDPIILYSSNTCDMIVGDINRSEINSVNNLNPEIHNPCIVFGGETPSRISAADLKSQTQEKEIEITIPSQDIKITTSSQDIKQGVEITNPQQNIEDDNSKAFWDQYNEIYADSLVFRHFVDNKGKKDEITGYINILSKFSLSTIAYEVVNNIRKKKTNYNEWTLGYIMCRQSSHLQNSQLWKEVLNCAEGDEEILKELDTTMKQNPKYNSLKGDPDNSKP